MRLGMKGLGHHFGGSGVPFWSHFGGLGGFWLPNASWKASWAALGRFSEPRWLQLEAQEGSKLEPKLHKNRCENLSKNRLHSKLIFEGFLIDFGSEHGGKLAPKSDQNSIKIDQKSILEASGPPSAFLDTFWAALGAVWRRLGG